MSDSIALARVEDSREPPRSTYERLEGSVVSPFHRPIDSYWNAVSHWSFRPAQAGSGEGNGGTRSGGLLGGPIQKQETVIEGECRRAPLSLGPVGDSQPESELEAQPARSRTGRIEANRHKSRGPDQAA